MIFSCQAILFDLDGVLVDSTVAVERVWRRWAHDHHVDSDFVMANAHGRRSVETLRLVAPELDAEKENLHVEQMEIEDKEGIVPIPGAKEFLSSLPSDRFMIVTSATAALASARLRYAGLPLPARLITAEDVREGKPSPEPYMKGAAALSYAPVDCLVFEDTPAGIGSGKAAGMRVIALATTYPGKELSTADAIVDSFLTVKARMEHGTLRVELL